MDNNSSLVKKAESNIRDLLSLMKRSPIIGVIVILILITPTGFYVYERFFVIECLKKQLKDSNSKYKAISTDLQDTKMERDKAQIQLAPFLAIANKNFPQDPQNEQPKLLLNKIEKLLCEIKETADKITPQRIIPKDIIDKLIAKLKTLQPLYLQIAIPAGDNEALELATQIKKAFEMANWKDIDSIRHFLCYEPQKHLYVEFKNKPSNDMLDAIFPLYDTFDYPRKFRINEHLSEDRFPKKEFADMMGMSEESLRKSSEELKKRSKYYAELVGGEEKVEMRITVGSK
jgi:hypothetical protein